MFAERVDKLTQGGVKIDAMPAGQIVPPFEVLDATNKKVLDGWHAISYYWVGKNPAAALFAGPPGGPFGMDHMDYMGWLYVGGGTICPAAWASILRVPCVSFSVRSAKILKCSCSVLLAGQVDCIFSVRGAGAWASAPPFHPAANAAQIPATPNAIARLSMTTLSLLDVRGATLSCGRSACQSAIPMHLDGHRRTTRVRLQRFAHSAYSAGRDPKLE